MGLKEQIRRFRAWQKEAVHYSDEHLEPHHCPNCGHDFEGNYCPVYRQNAGDGRITWKWVYKCVMEVWGMESRSLPYTVLQLIFRPGYLIHDYLNGRRQTSYTPVNMLFIIALVYVVVAQLLGIRDAEPLEAKDGSFELLVNASNWMAAHPAWAMIGMTMIMILPTWFIFRFAPRHARLSLPEGIIMQIFMGSLMLLVIFAIRITPWLFWLAPFYYYVTYRQLFGYGRWGTLWRVALCFLVWFNVVLLMAVLATLTDKDAGVIDQQEGIVVIITIFALMSLLTAFFIFIGWIISKPKVKKHERQS